MDIRKLVRKEVALLKAYEAKEVGCRIKLDANESPYGLTDAVQMVAGIRTNRYPDPEAKVLKQVLAKDLGVKTENVLFGNGSDELIFYLITTFGGPVAYPVPTFTMYGIIGQAVGAKRVEIPLDNDFDIDVRSFLASSRKEKPKLIFLSSPNNPTGNCFSTDRILKIIEASTGMVIVDEAYQPFSSETGMLPLLKDYPNLIIMRTLSKIGLAALRLGFMIADPDIIGEVNKVRLPFNVNAFSQAIATAALRKKKEFRASVKTIVAERARLGEEMEKIKGVSPFPSEANFILFRMDDPDYVYSALLKKGILVRNIKDFVEGCLRVTVGTPEENTAFLKALKQIMR
jgi:histidinol-phosphate aminotransferase